MRTLTKLSLVVGLALTLGAPAGAVVSIGLVQVGGTFSASTGPNPGDTLVLSITYSLEAGDAVTLIDPALKFVGMVQSFNAAGSTETGGSLWGGQIFGPVATGDIALVTPNLANGWEKGTTYAGGVSNPCTYGPGGACTSLGTASFVLSGTNGIISIAGSAGMPGGTTIADGTFVDITGISNLGEFVLVGYPVPEPTTASLLGLGLLGLTAASRRRKI